jgi:carbamoyltransferase
MNILGILYLDHDPTACLFRDGEIIALAEEERFVRIKHADGLFPINAIKFCLKQGNISMMLIKYQNISWSFGKNTKMLLMKEALSGRNVF